jgi:Kef-type K+ transport system membrane component KefB
MLKGAASDSMSQSTQITLVSVVVGTLAMVALFDAPVVPAVLGGVAAGVLLYASERVQSIRRR